MERKSFVFIMSTIDSHRFNLFLVFSFPGLNRFVVGSHFGSVSLFSDYWGYSGINIQL